MEALQQHKEFVELHHAPGVIKEEVGQVSFAQDFLTVKLDLTPMNTLVKALSDAHIQVGNLLGHPEKNVIERNTLQLLEAEQEQLAHLLPSVSASRSKRSLFSWGGDLLHAVFGTATDKQIQETKDKIKAIEQWASMKGTLMKKTIKRLNSNSDRIVGLNKDVLVLTDLINKHSVILDKIKCNQVALSISGYLEFMIDQYEMLSNALVLANRNIVSPNLLAPSDLGNILKDAKDDYRFNLYFDEDISKYYTVLQVKVVKDAMYVFVPFRSSLQLKLFNFIPFPTLLNNSIVAELDIQSSYVLLTDRFDAIALTTKVYFEKKCMAVAASNYICPASAIQFFPTDRYSCLLNLAVHTNTTSACKFKRSVVDKLKVHNVSPYLYFFVKDQAQFTLSCGNDSPRLVTLQGNFKVAEDCGVYSPGLIKIFPSHSQVTVVNPSIPNFRRVVLRLLSFTEEKTKLVVDKLSTPEPLDVNLEDEADAWLHESLRDAHPYVTYIGTPVLVLVVALLLAYIGRRIYICRIQRVLTEVSAVNERLALESEHGASTST